MSAEELVRQAYRLVRRGDPRDLLALVAPDATWEPAQETGKQPCRDGRELVSTLLRLGAMHRLRASDFVGVGDHVVVTLHGTRMNRLGASWWGWRIFQVVRVREGRIAELRDFRRREDAYSAAGLRGR